MLSGDREIEHWLKMGKETKYNARGSKNFGNH